MENKSQSLPAAAASPQPWARESIIVGNLSFPGPMPDVYNEYGGVEMSGTTTIDSVESTVHDPATCWWCLNPGPRRALGRSGMEFTDSHRG